MQLQIHPLADKFPRLPDDQLTDLKVDIRKRGVINPITTYQGQILDGRHRYDIALNLGLPCPMAEYDGDDPAGYVLAQNLMRRHLPAMTRAKIVLEVHAWKPPGRPQDEKSRNFATFDQDAPPQRDSDLKSDGDQGAHRPPEPATAPASGAAPQPVPERTYTRQELADMAEVSPRTIDTARAELTREREASEQATTSEQPTPATPRRQRTAERTPSLRQKHEDALNLLSAARKENTVLARKIKDIERRLKAVLDDARPDLAARIQEMEGVQRELETARDRMQMWQNRYGEEQRRTQMVRKERDYYAGLCAQHGIDTSGAPK